MALAGISHTKYVKFFGCCIEAITHLMEKTQIMELYRIYQDKGEKRWHKQQEGLFGILLLTLTKQRQNMESIMAKTLSASHIKKRKIWRRNDGIGLEPTTVEIFLTAQIRRENKHLEEKKH